MGVYDVMQSWATCERCNLHTTRRQVVIGKGRIPADILFVGIGPGKTENLMGEPFVGESGRLLMQIIDDAMALVNQGNCELARTPTYYITNMVACRPCDDKHGPNRDPVDGEIIQCMPRVRQTHIMVQPSLVILLGKLVNQWYGRTWPCTYEFSHPRYLLSKGGKASPLYMSYVRRLADAITSTLAKELG